MITGDNPLTACSVASKLRMLGQDREQSREAGSVLILRHRKNSTNGNELVWVRAGDEDEGATEDARSNHTIPYEPDSIWTLRDGGLVHLCVTGDAIAELLRRVNDVGKGEIDADHERSNARTCEALRYVL